MTNHVLSAAEWAERLRIVAERLAELDGLHPPIRDEDPDFVC